MTETAYLIALESVRHGLSWDNVAIATGQNFPDALAGGVLQGTTGSVVLLTPPNNLDYWTHKALVDNNRYIETVRFLGGDAVISTSVRAQIKQLLE